MVDISKYPYFSYDELLDKLMSPIVCQADVHFVSFRRNYKNFEQLLIVHSRHKEIANSFYAKELYKLSSFGYNPSTMPSGYFMTDHIYNISSQQLYRYLLDKHGCDHGLLVFQKHEDFCDLFSFSSRPQNSIINNYYLNQKGLFTQFIQEFYQQFAPILDNIAKYKLILPIPTLSMSKSLIQTNTKQLECGGLMIQGYSSKEIGKIMQLSPRTVEFYINILKQKHGAKNRAHLTHILRDNFRL